MALAKPLDGIVIEKGIKDDEFYEGLIELHKALIDEREFQAAYLSLKNLIAIKEQRRFKNKPV